MFVEVAVFGFTIQPGTYTYRADPSLKLVPGQAVSVPFGKESRSGLIVSVRASAPAGVAIKEVSAVKSQAAVVTVEQIELARAISETYFISLADALELMLPRLPKFELEEGSQSQKLYLFPTIRQAQAAARGGLVFTHTASAKEFDRLWQEIGRGEVKEVFGARSALFAPFQKLTEINIFQTESDLYKEERRPYYRALEVASMLARIHRAKLNPVSYSPRVADQFRVAHEVRAVEPNFTYSMQNLRQVPLVNDHLRAFIAQPGRTLVFLNRKTESGPLRCLTCRVRSFTSDPTVCPNCGSANVKFQIFNLRTVAEQLSKEAGPETTLAKQMNEMSLRMNTLAKAKVAKSVALAKTRVAEGVTFATQQIFFQNPLFFDRIALLSADTYLTSGSYLAAEKTFQLLTSLRRLLAPDGQILVQTGFPDLPCIQNSLQGNYDAFYQTELRGRRETGYPPFSQLAKLTWNGRGQSELNLPESLEVFGPFDDRGAKYFIVRGQDLSPLAELGRVWKLDIDPANL